VSDVQGVLNTLAAKELEVQTKEGAWYTMRIIPYRTLENVIEGAVITFVDITEVVRARLALRKANDQLRLAVVVRDAHDAITMQDLDGRILAWNPAAERLYGWRESEALTMNIRDRIPQALYAQALNKVHQLSRAEALSTYNTSVLAKDGAVVEVSMTATALVNELGEVYAISTTERLRDPKLNGKAGAP
jgi:two-component system CheB/CheR fusion protein